MEHDEVLLDLEESLSGAVFLQKGKLRFHGSSAPRREGLDHDRDVIVELHLCTEVATYRNSEQAVNVLSRIGELVRVQRVCPRQLGHQAQCTTLRGASTAHLVTSHYIVRILLEEPEVEAVLI